MANFPTGIRASSILWLPGTIPAADSRTDAGNYQPIGGSNTPNGRKVRLSFSNITRTQFQAIRDHYLGEGTTGSWLLSPQLVDCAGHDPSMATRKWRYATPPKGIDSPTADVHSIEDIELEEVPTLVWIDRITVTARPLTVRITGGANVIGPDVLPTIWSSRLVTPNNVTSGAYRSDGTMAIDENNGGANYQAFWFAPSGSTYSRIVLVARSEAGQILWQRWTSSGLDSVNAGKESYPPAVAPLAGGGCVVAARRSLTYYPSDPMRVWVYEADGTLRWAKDYSVACAGPAQMIHNASTGEIIIGTSARNGSSQYVPAILRVNATNGNWIGGQTFTVDSVESEFRRMIIDSAGNLLFLSQRMTGGTNIRAYLVKLSSAFAVVTVSAYSSNPATGPTTADRSLIELPDGTFLIGTYGNIGSATVGLLQVSATFGPLNHFIYPRTGGGYMLSNIHATAAFDSTGNGWMVARGSNTFSGAYDYAVTALALTSQGSGVDYITEAETELEPMPLVGPYGTNQYQLDPERRRMVIHTSGEYTANYSCIAEGWALEQPSTTLVLDIGSSRNLRGLTTDPAPGSVTTGPTVIRAIVSATAATLSGSAGTVSMTMGDASGSLTWDYQRVVG